MNNKIVNFIYKIVFVSFIIYSSIFIGMTFYINVQLAMLLIPLTILVYYVGYKYISPKDFSLPQYCSLRNKTSYIFLLFIIITLNYIPSSGVENYTNYFTILPQKSLSCYNNYINYVLITGIFLIIIPDIQYSSVDRNAWQNNSHILTNILKILGIISLFSTMTFLTYTKELKDSPNIILQGIFLWLICYMLALIFIIVKFFIMQFFNNFQKNIKGE